MDFYWEKFMQSGNVEYYLKYRALDQKDQYYCIRTVEAENGIYQGISQCGGI